MTAGKRFSILLQALGITLVIFLGMGYYEHKTGKQVKRWIPAVIALIALTLLYYYNNKNMRKDMRSAIDVSNKTDESNGSTK